MLVTVTGFKGGVGKSTVAIHLAAYLSDLGRTVLVDGDPNRTAMAWAGRGALPFEVVDERQAIKRVGGADHVVIDTPARPHSDDLKELASGCDLLILPTSPDVVALEPMLETARDLGDAVYWALLTIVPPHPSREGEQMRDDLREAGVPVFESMIRRTSAYPKAALAGRPIRDLGDSRARAAWQDFQSLGDEIRRLLKWGNTGASSKKRRNQ